MILESGLADVWIENHQVASFYVNRSNLINFADTPFLEEVSALGIINIQQPKEHSLAQSLSIIPIENTMGEYAIAVNKEHLRLARILNKVLAGLQKGGTLRRLDIRWFGLEMPRQFDYTKLWITILLMLLVFSTIGCTLLMYNESLRLKVIEKTQELEEQNWKLKGFALNTAHAFGSAIEFKDMYTGGHSQRVAEISSTIGQKIVLDEEQLFKLYIGALIHDIGKVGIPDEVLNKPGNLSEEEYGIIKQHPQIGEVILSHIGGYEAIREIRSNKGDCHKPS